MDALKFAIQEEVLAGTKIKVVGVGGGGSNAVARMMNEGLQGVEFHILNTDVQALNASQVPNKLAIGSKVTNGLGAGSDPGLGRQADSGAARAFGHGGRRRRFNGLATGCAGHEDGQDRHLIEQPMLGRCGSGTGWPARVSSMAARSSSPVTGLPLPGVDWSNAPR